MKLFSGSIAFVLAVLLAPAAFGSVDWTGTGPDSAFSNGANWTTASSTGVVPGPSDSTHIFPGFTTVADQGLDITVNPGGPLVVNVTSNTNQSVQELLVSSNFEANTFPTGVLNLEFRAGSTLTVGASTGNGVILTGSTTVNFAGNMNIISGGLFVGVSQSNIDFGQVTGPGTLNFTSGNINLDGGDGAVLVVGQGSTGTINQTNAVVTTGQDLTIGVAGANAVGAGTSVGNGTYNLNGNSVLNIGTPGDPSFVSYNVTIGNAGSTGTLNINDNSTFNANNGNMFFQVGTGTINQSGTSTVYLGGVSAIIGFSGNGVYNLQSGSLAISSNTFTLGTSSGTGTLNQTGGTLTSAANTDFIVGGGGVGTYNLQSGTAVLNGGLTIGSTGVVTQTGGTLTIPVGQAINLTTAGGFYTLGGGGVLQVGSTDGTVAGSGLQGTGGQGQMIFAGGTLQVIGTNNLVLSADSSLASGTVSTFDTTNANIIIAGNLGGAGGLNVTGGNFLALSGTATYTGSTNVTSGTFLSTFGNVLNSSALNTGSAGTMDLILPTGGAAYGGSVNNSGLLNLGFGTAGDTLAIAGTVNSSGTIVMGANGIGGNLQVANGSIGNVSDAGTGSSVTIGGGSGSGVVHMTGVNSYTGTTTVNGGYTLLANNFVGNVVNNGGVIGTMGTMSTPTPLVIGGSLTSNGTMFVRANGVAADSFVVNGATPTTLSGMVAVIGSGTKTYTLVSTNPGLLTIGGNGNINDPNGLTTSPPQTLFSSTLSFDPANGNLLLNTVQVPLSVFAQTGNQLAVANALDPFTQTPPPAFQPMLTAFNLLPASAIPVALDQISPEALQYSSTIAFENATMMVQTVDGALANFRAGYAGVDASGLNVMSQGFTNGLGRSMGSLLAYNPPSFHQAAPNGVNYYPDDNSASPATSGPASSPTADSTGQTISDSPTPNIPMRTSPTQTLRKPNFSEFIGGDVVLADLNQNPGNTPTKASYTAADIIAGVCFRMTSNLTAGVLFDYNHTDASTDGYGSKTKVDSYTPGIFASYFDKGFYVNGLFAFGYNTYSNSRQIPVFGVTANSSPDGQQYITNFDGGYDFHPDKHWTLGPTLGVTYTHLDVDSFTETGAQAMGADLAVNSQSTDSVRTRLGGHVAYEIRSGSILFQPNLTVMWQHEYLNDPYNITSSFSDIGSGPFTIQSTAPGSDSAILGAGMTATLDNTMAIYLNYIADVGSSSYFAQSIMGGFKASF